MKLNLQLPDPIQTETKESAQVVEDTLLELKSIIEERYNALIQVEIVTSSQTNLEDVMVLYYAVYLVFAAKNNFSYRLLEVTCTNPDGGLPVAVSAFVGPSKSFGTAHTKEALNRVIEEVFREERTQRILSNYRPL